MNLKTLLKLNKALTAIFVCFLFGGLFGCQHATANKSSQPAVLTNLADKGVKQELLHAISQLIGSKNITISDSVFSKSDQLFIERKIILDNRNLPINGKILEMPKVVFLEKIYNTCILKYNKTTASIILKKAKCKVFKNA